ncbi:unnamed protein product [marine sediment metagenome]|uniref:Uncharacterized protein n=1 Tax=marine sediment metagenome TaxID=412755 RepID=X1BLC8_9ZZZZ
MNWVLSHSKQLDLWEMTNREKICFDSDDEVTSEIDLIKNYRERRKREKELLADRSIEEIISELDNFVQSKEFQAFKDSGVTFYSDVKCVFSYYVNNSW